MEKPSDPLGIGTFEQKQIQTLKAKPYWILAAIVAVWWLFFRK